MSHGATEAERSSSDVRFWKTSRSLGEIADHLERSLEDKQALERRLAEVLEENRNLKLHSSETTAEFADERDRLKAQIAGLQAQMAQTRERTPEKSGAGRGEAELAARERLLKDEFERKVQELKVELNRERQRFAKETEEMKQQLAGCLCADIRIGNIEESQGASSALPERWRTRKAK